MDLRQRLAQLDRLSRRPAAASAEPIGLAVDPREILAELDLARVEGPAGPVWVRDYEDSLESVPDSLPDLRHFFSHVEEESPPADAILFLDTETTGLAGGTGTIPFLVGASWFAGGTLATRQFFLPGPGHEGAMLRSLAILAARFRVVVTYNGASFDLPLLRTRARLNRLDDPLGPLAGWDLLVPSRRLWGRELLNCRQQTLEAAVCRAARGGGDIEGARIPQAWFDFVHGGRRGLLPEVLRHNHRDMVGMALIFGRVVRLAEALEGREVYEPASWRLAWSLGRICEMRKDQESALSWLETAIAKGNGAGEKPLAEPRFLADVIRVSKRHGDWERVERIILAGLAAGVRDPWLHREAAILYEHRLVRLRIALDHAARSGEDHRVRRLERLVAAKAERGHSTGRGGER
jgi:uncharacterized protein YprB with RNaseH-like and TPR domain